jgi:hypothetical protein
MTGDIPRRNDELASGPASLEEQLLSPAYRVSRESFWDRARALGDDGYDVMERARVYRWLPVPSWGRDGWDLGAWPLVVMYLRTAGEQYELAYYVEGDVTVYRYPTRELRDAATDALAFWHWKHAGEEWVAGIDRVEDAPAHLRGPFSWKRLERSQEDQWCARLDSPCTER